MLAVVAAFVASLFFRGIGDNLIALVATSGLLLGALTFVGSARLVDTAFGFPRTILMVVLALLVLILNYRWSLSKDTTFAAAWVIAALPLALLACLQLDAAMRDRLARALVGVATLLALISLFRFVAYGERAHLPLIDPNNYATLMYLCWIPTVHRWLSQEWSDIRRWSRRYLGHFALSFVLLVALFATHSRTGTLIVVGAFVVWGMTAIIRRKPVRELFPHLIAALAAQALVLLASPADFVSGRVASLGVGLSVRLDLIEAGWRMFLDHPFTGVGVFCFGLLYGGYRPLSEQTTAGLFVHNDYVQLLAEGGVALALLPVVLGLYATMRLGRGLRGSAESFAFQGAGYAMAIGATCAHALVNFVFFSLPLCVLIGVAAALAQEDETRPRGESHQRGMQWGVRGVLAFGWICFAYLLVDLLTLGVFQGQKNVPFADRIRSDPERRLKYARFARAVNTNRGVPVLAEAMLLAMKSDEPGASKYPAERALTDFRLAVEADPFNPLAYLAFADFVSRHGGLLELRAGETREELLLRALGADRVDVRAIDGLLDLYSQSGRVGDAYALLKSVVFPWLELLKRRDDAAADRYAAEMIRLARIAGDVEFVAAVERKVEHLRSVAPVTYRTWFDPAS